MTGAEVTLFVEALPARVRAAPDRRAPVLEKLVARGEALPRVSGLPDALRLRAFGVPDAAGLPVGALSAAAGHGAPQPGYWLRADPVLLRPGMTQVYLAGAGMAGFSDAERDAVSSAVRDELARYGYEIGHVDASGWGVRLDGDPGCRFAPLDEVLGADIEAYLDDSPQARPWRALMTQLQVLLHNHPVMADRRQRGQAVLNGVWFWGGGPLPGMASPPPLTRVVSDHPVSAGMAVACALSRHPFPSDTAALVDLLRSGESVWIDWPVARREAAAAIGDLDRVAGALLERLPGARLVLRAGDRGWRLPPGRLGAFWRRARPLRNAFGDSRPA